MTGQVKRLPIPGEIIAVKQAGAVISTTSRVLEVNESSDRIVLISIEPRRSSGRIYFLQPAVQRLSAVMTSLDGKLLHILTKGVIHRPDVAASDLDLDKKYRRPGQAISNIRRERNKRYDAIKPLVQDPDDRALLFDEQVRRERIEVRAQEIHTGSSSLARTRKYLSEILNQYFAEGSTPGAVTPFSGAKGGRGKERKQVRKIGRPNTPTKNGRKEAKGFVMSEHDKEICGFCWRNYYIRGTTIPKALRRMWREFYSTMETDERGQLHSKLLPVLDRPTHSQFLRWGKQRSPGHESWKKQLTKFSLNRIGRVLYGTADQDVLAVGQRGAVDSTSVDIEFVSVANRLDRIGSANRILIIDGMWDYISGFYLGLEAASAQTVGLAFLHSLTDKRAWLQWLGLTDQDPLNWIPISYSTVMADNTDLRCDAVIEKLDGINTGIKFVGVARSDLNSAAEAGHHTLHRSVDHNMHGTTHGRRHERGEDYADLLARHTVIEAIRETARAVYLHNTMELDIRPTLEMRRELVDKGIKLTRANLTRWAINRGRCRSSLIGEDEARTKLLVPIRGTFTPHGVKLLRPDTGRRREFVEPVRYISRHKLILDRVLQSKVGRERLHAEDFDDDFLHNPYQPTHIFYRNQNTGEMIPLDAVTKDNDLLFECSHADVLHLMKRDALHLYDATASRDEALSDMEGAQEITKQEAADAYQDALDRCEKPPSKSSLRANKKENRLREKDTYLYGMPIQTLSTQGREMLVEAEEKPTAVDSISSPADQPGSALSPSPPTSPEASGISSNTGALLTGTSVLLSAIKRRRPGGSQHAH